MTSWVEGLRPTRHKIGHFEGVLPSKFPGAVGGARCQIEHTPKVYIPLFINRITTSSRTTLIGTKLNFCGSMLFLLECIERSVSKQLDRSSWYLAWRLPRRIRHCFKANSGNSKNKDISCKLCLKLLSGTLSRTLNCESFGTARRSLLWLECDRCPYIGGHQTACTVCTYHCWLFSATTSELAHLAAATTPDRHRRMRLLRWLCRRRPGSERAIS